MDSATHERFRTTNWTVIRALHGDADGDRRRAADLLARRYWPPVYAQLRAQGKPADEAADLTQEFFHQVVMGRNLLDRAEPGRGKLRSLILASLRRFLIDQHRRGVVRGSGQTIPLESIREEEAKCPASAYGDSTDPFDRRWAMAVLEEALQRCESHFISSNRQRHWKLFDLWVLQPAINNTSPGTLAEAAREAGFPTPALAASALQVVRNRVIALLREVTAETVDEESDVESELARIREYVSV